MLHNILNTLTFESKLFFNVWIFFFFLDNQPFLQKRKRFPRWDQPNVPTKSKLSDIFILAWTFGPYKHIKTPTNSEHSPHTELELHTHVGMLPHCGKGFPVNLLLTAQTTLS